MRAARVLAAGLMVAFVLVLSARAEEKPKEVTLEGKLVCGKCTLDVTKACCNVLQVEKGGKKVSYFLKDKGKAEKYHKGICPPGSEKEATVTGTVAKQGEKMVITPSKVEVK